MARRSADSPRREKATCDWELTGAHSIGLLPIISATGKVMVFGEVIDKDGSPFGADIRGILKAYGNELHKREGYTLNAANEIEGFLFAGVDAEKHYTETGKFEYVNTGGYYHSLPGDPLRTFIDTCAEVQRSMGFQNEKDQSRSGAFTI